MKYNAHSDEQSCGRRVPGELSDKYDDLGGLACMRIAGYDGECVAITRDAGPGELSDKYDDLDGLACMRTAGHDGECVAITRDAGIADGVHWCCRVKLDNEEHAAWCAIRGASRDGRDN